MTKNLIILPIEPLEERYTAQWHSFLPRFFNENTRFNVISVDGLQGITSCTDGGFLNFVDTVAWKSTQMAKIAMIFEDGNIKSGDIFLVTDAWNPCVHMIRYMSSILGLDIKIIGFWHAGSYDPHDWLGRKFDKTWSFDLEKSLYELYDINVFATKFHFDLFSRSISTTDRHAIVGFPFDYLEDITVDVDKLIKKNTVVFPHRKVDEKGYDDFVKWEPIIPLEKIVSLDVTNTKEDFYSLLRKCEYAVSFAKQETLGIAMYESFLRGCIPIVPDRLSYREMYLEEFKYKESPNEVISLFENMPYAQKIDLLESQKDKFRNYFNGDELIQILRDLDID